MRRYRKPMDTYYHVLLTGQADVARKLDSALF